MLKDTAEKYYFDNYNCAESVFLAANEYYSLGVDPSLSKMVGGFACVFLLHRFTDVPPGHGEK